MGGTAPFHPPGVAGGGEEGVLILNGRDEERHLTQCEDIILILYFKLYSRILQRIPKWELPPPPFGAKNVSDSNIAEEDHQEAGKCTAYQQRFCSLRGKTLLLHRKFPPVQSNF